MFHASDAHNNSTLHGRNFCPHLADEKNPGKKHWSERRLSLGFQWTANHTQKNVAFILQRLQWSSPKFARFITPPSLFHSALFIPGLGGAGPADTWRAASQHRVGAPHSKGPAECRLWSHTVFLSCPGANMLFYKYRKPCKKKLYLLGKGCGGKASYPTTSDSAQCPGCGAECRRTCAHTQFQSWATVSTAYAVWTSWSISTALIYIDSGPFTYIGFGEEWKHV